MENLDKTVFTSKEDDFSENNPLRIIPSEQIIPFKQRLKDIIGQESVRSFGRRCGLAEKTLRNYMAGKQYPTLDRLALIAETSGKSISWLATGEERTNTLAEPMTPYVNQVVETQPLDKQLLETSIEAIEVLCDKRNIKMSPKKKAKIVTLVYMMSLEDKKLDESLCYQLVELAS